MRTLALLATLLLLALHGQAELQEETADQVPEPEAQLPAQDEAEAEDQDVAISFDGRDARAGTTAAPLRPLRPLHRCLIRQCLKPTFTPGSTCRCRRHACLEGETVTTKCIRGGMRFLRCCRN